jgi:uncharacterized protein (TIGR00290 family)
MPKKILVAWSGGKDSAMALGQLLHSPEFQVVGLLTTFREDEVVAMHEVPKSLIASQAKAAGLSLWACMSGASKPYESAMREVLEKAKREGIEAVAYGDLFLEDIRSYRVRLHEGTGITALFPIFGEDTSQLPFKFQSLGYQAIVVSIDLKRLTPNFCGRFYDGDFLTSIPADVDPCGERGEFHSFVFNAPYFSERIAYSIGGFRDIIFEDPTHPFACRVCDLLGPE